MHDELEIDLREYLKVLGKWKWMIGAFTVLATLTAGLLSWFVLPPVYQSKAVLLVSQVEEQRVVRQTEDLRDVVNTVSRLPEMTINTYVNQIKNQELFRRVAGKLRLDSELYTPETLAGMVTAKAVKDTNLIEVQVENTDPDLAARFANALAEELILFVQENNQQQLAKSVELLQQQAASTDQELAAAVDKLKKFDAQPRSPEYLQQEMQSRLADLSQFRSQLAQVEVEYQQLLAGQAHLRQQLKLTPPTSEVTEEQPAADPAAPPQTVRRTVPNPAYAALQQQLDAKEVAVAEKEAQLAGLRAAVGRLEKESEALQAELAGKKAERDRLQRDVDRLKTAYDVLAQKITETRIARSVNIGGTTLSLMAKAVVPTSPVKPNKRLNVAVALLVGMMLSVSLAFLLEYLKNTIETAEDVQRHLGLPVLGNIPLMSGLSRQSTGTPAASLPAPALPGVQDPAPVHHLAEPAAEATGGRSE